MIHEIDIDKSTKILYTYVSAQHGDQGPHGEPLEESYPARYEVQELVINGVSVYLDETTYHRAHTILDNFLTSEAEKLI